MNEFSLPLDQRSVLVLSKDLSWVFFLVLLLLLLFVCFSRFNVAKQENEQAKHDE